MSRGIGVIAEREFPTCVEYDGRFLGRSFSIFRLQPRCSSVHRGAAPPHSAAAISPSRPSCPCSPIRTSDAFPPPRRDCKLVHASCVMVYESRIASQHHFYIIILKKRYKNKFYKCKREEERKRGIREAFWKAMSWAVRYANEMPFAKLRTWKLFGMRTRFSTAIYS